MQSILAKIKKLNDLLNYYKTLLLQKQVQETKPPMSLSEYCATMVGMDASPENKANPAVACAETVSFLARYIVPNFPTILSTFELDKYLSAHYKRLNSPAPNLIIVSPTGWGNGKLSNGHTGIVGDKNIIYSNDSDTGKLGKYWTIKKWADYYAIYGGMPMHYYDLTQPL